MKKINEDYTHEPWQVEGHVIFGIVDGELRVLGKMDSLIIKDGKGINLIRYANARRIVACINACVGKSTEELEQIDV